MNTIVVAIVIALVAALLPAVPVKAAGRTITVTAVHEEPGNDWFETDDGVYYCIDPSMPCPPVGTVLYETDDSDYYIFAASGSYQRLSKFEPKPLPEVEVEPTPTPEPEPEPEPETTEQPTEEPTTEATTETPEEKKVEPKTEEPTEEPTTEVPTEEPTTEVEITVEEEPTTEVEITVEEEPTTETTETTTEAPKKPETSKKVLPQTGDKAFIALALIIFMITIVGIMAIVINRKNRLRVLDNDKNHYIK